jgi:hypothetical protein
MYKADSNLRSLGVNTVSNRSISRLAELVLIPSVDKDVPFEQTNPELGLYLSNNRLARAPSALFNLEHLTYLSLRNNQILELPPSIGKLRNLRELNISLNRLRYLPGELLSLLKFPSALSSLHIHPNPFHRPEGCLPLPPRPMPEGGVYSESHGDVFIPSRHLPMFPSDNVTMFVTQDDRSAEEICRQFHLLAGKDDGQYAETAGAWHVALLTRSQVQYSDSCGSVLSKFRLPCEQSEDVQSRGFGEGQQVTLQTEDPSVFSVPCLTGRLPDDPSQPSHVLTLFELALKSASRAAQTWDLASCLPPQAPSSVLRSIDRIMAQTAFNGNSGTLPCSICGRQVTTPTAQWIEWWDISKWEHRPRPGGSQGHEWAPEPLSINPNEYAIPFLKRGCSWNCTPRPMKIGQCMPGTLQFQWA